MCTDVSEKTAASVRVDVNWWWRQHISPKYRYISTIVQKYLLVFKSGS